MTLQFHSIPGGGCCGLQVARDVDLQLLGHPDGRQGEGGAGHAGAPGGEKDVAPAVHVLHSTGRVGWVNFTNSGLMNSISSKRN